MASTYSTNLKIEIMATGENSGTWGTITNTNLGTALEQAIVGYGNPSFASDANLTLTYTDTNAAQAARALVLNVTSAVSLTGTRELVVPTIQKQYIVQNNTTGSQSITVKTSGGTGITVPNGRKAHLYVNGTNVIQMFDFVDINGGAIDGTTVGASSASTGAFTTLTASGATTLNGAVALGDAAADLITVPGTVNSNVIFTDNTFDIGASGATRPRTGYFGTSVLSPLVTATNVQVTNVKANDGTVAVTITDSTGAVGVSTAFTLSTATGNIALGTSQTSGTFTVGGASQTGNITLDQSTKAHTLNIGSGATENATTKTINIGTGGVSGSTTTITIGSSNGTTTTFNGTVNVTTLDLTNLEVTNIKAKDGTAAIVLTDSTGAVTISTALTANGGAVFNENGANVDFRVEGDNEANLLFVDASADAVGIGTNAPGAKLAVSGAFTSQNNIVSITSSGVSSAATGNVRGLYVNTQTANTASAVYGVFSEITYTSSQPNYAGYFSAGDPTGNSYGVYGLASQTDVNGPGTAFGGYFRATAGGSGTTGSTYGVRVENAAALGAAAYGLVVSTVAGASTVVPFQVIHAGSDLMRLNASGNLGIGTTSPGNRLSVVSAAAGDAITFSNAAASNKTGFLYSDSQYVGLMTIGGAGNNQGILFDLNNNRTLIQRIGGTTATFDSSGNLGIGASPTARLSIGDPGTGLDFTNAASGNFNIGLLAGTGSALAYIFQRANSDLLFGTSNTEKVRLTSTGTLNIVGAGTAGSTQAISFNGSTPVDTLVTTSTGVGIGTNAPAYKLDVSTTSGDTQAAVYDRSSGSSAARFDLRTSGTGASQWYIQTGNTTSGLNGSLRFYDQTNNLERMRLDSSGNLGIGTNAPVSKLQVTDANKVFDTYGNLNVYTSDTATVGAGGAIGFGGNNGTGGTSPYVFAKIQGIKEGATNTWNGALLFGTTAGSSAVIERARITSTGEFQWKPDGTTQAMTLDASGDLIIGDTNTNGIRLSIVKNNPTRGILAHIYNIATSGQTGAQIQFTQSAIDNWAVGQPAGENAFAFWSSRNTAADGTERMRITSGGDLLVGTTSGNVGSYGKAISLAATASTYAGLEISGTTGGALEFQTSQSTRQVQLLGNSSGFLIYSNGGSGLAERARITSGGYFKAQGTSTYFSSSGLYHELIAAEASDPVVVVYNKNGSFVGNMIQGYSDRTPSAGTYRWINFQNGGVTRFQVLDTGDCQNANNSYAGTSDEKLKQDIVDSGSQWDDVKNLRVRKFRFKSDPDGQMQIGLVAQEVETVSPGLVIDTPDYETVEVQAVDADGNLVMDADGNPVMDRKHQPTGSSTKAVKYSVLYMKSVKALQEAMARIETLEAKIAVLESKGV